MGSTSGRTNEGLGRRDLIKRSAALGLIAVPTMSFLSACASSDSGSDEKVEKGTKSAKNPLGVNETAALEVVIFNGGFGEQYAIDAEKKYNAAFPKAPKVKHSATEKIQSILQPRFNGGTPPDLIDNSGAEQMDMGVLVGKKQLADLTPLMDAPSYDDPSKKVRDTLRPGVLEMGQFDGDPVWIMYYAYTVYGVWYSQTNLEKLDAAYPETWDEMLALCEKAKKKGIMRLDVPRQVPVLPAVLALPLHRQDRWPRGPRQDRQPGAERLEGPGRQGRVRGVLRALPEGLHPQGHARPDPHPVADGVDQGQGALHPERFVGGERGRADHAGGLQDDGRGTVQPGRLRQASLRHDLGLRW